MPGNGNDVSAVLSHIDEQDDSCSTVVEIHTHTAYMCARVCSTIDTCSTMYVIMYVHTTDLDKIVGWVIPVLRIVDHPLPTRTHYQDRRVADHAEVVLRDSTVPGETA